jgi:hypothetical protein
VVQTTGYEHKNAASPGGATESVVAPFPPPRPGLGFNVATNRWFAPPANVRDASGVRGLSTRKTRHICPRFYLYETVSAKSAVSYKLAVASPLV